MYMYWLIGRQVLPVDMIGAEYNYRARIEEWVMSCSRRLESP
jgi:hypothetical protein